MSKISSILVVRPDALGDAVISFQVIPWLKKWFPDAKLTFLVRDEFKDILLGVPGVDAVISDPLPYRISLVDMGIFLKAASWLRSFEFDCFIGLWELPRYALLSYLARIPYRFGHQTSLVNKWFYSSCTRFDYDDFMLHQCEWNYRVISLAKRYSHCDNGNMSSLSHFSVFNAEVSVNGLKDGYVCLIVDTIPSKQLPLEGYRAILKTLMGQNVSQVVLCGNQSPLFLKELVDEFSSQVSLNDLVGQLSLSELKSVISRCRLFIGPDSGPVHIAALFAVPCVVYYMNRNQNPFRWYPWRCDHWVIRYDQQAWKPPFLARHMEQPQSLSLSRLTDTIMEALNSKRNLRISLCDTFTKSVTIGVERGLSADILNAIEKRGYRFYIFDKCLKPQQLKSFILSHHINVLFSKKPSIKLKISTRLASNYSHFLPKIVRIQSKEDVFAFYDTYVERVISLVL